MLDVRALTSDARPVLDAVVATADGVVRRWRPRQVNHRPGRSTTVLHDVTVSWSGGPARQEQVVLHASRAPRPGIEPVAITDDGSVLSAWRVPHDPALPGMAAAVDVERMRCLLADLELPAAGPITTRLRAYRPLRRAVIEVTAPGARLFCKVVPPASAEALHRRHRLLEGAVPVPRSAGWSDDGVVVLEAAPGRTLRDALLTSRGPLPPPAAVVALLDRLPSSLLDLPGAPSPLDRVCDHAALLADVLPPARPRLDELVDALGPNGLDDPVVPTHGDLYEAQLLVDGGRVVGLLDVDGAGAGHRIDDLANLLGHLAVLDGDRPRALGRRVIATVDGLPGIDPAALRRRVAAVVVGLATGSFRVQQQDWPKHTLARLDTATAWLRSAGRAAERGLTNASR